MFTPPPSPLPVPRIIVTDDVPTLNHEDHNVKVSSMAIEKGLLTVPSAESILTLQQQAAVELAAERHRGKRRTARRMRWGVLVVPIVLILVALTSKRISALQNIDNPSLTLRLTRTNMESFDVPKHERVHDHYQHKRQATQLSQSSVQSTAILVSSISSTDSNSDTPTSTTSVPQTEQTIPPVPDSSDPPTLPTPFPQPYDTIGYTTGATTEGCLAFFQNMTQSDAFRTCRPFSLLVQFSSEFLQAQTNLSALNTLLWGTCNTTPSFSTCTENLEWFASSLKSSCSSELSSSNGMVQNTLLGLESYPLLRSAGCLVNQKTDTYCYAQAMHSSSAADTYLYSIPLGLAWPSTATPSCTPCASGLLSLYAETLKTGNDSAAGLEDTYEAAAEAAVNQCGNGYAAVNVAASGAAPRWPTILFGKDVWGNYYIGTGHLTRVITD